MDQKDGNIRDVEALIKDSMRRIAISQAIIVLETCDCIRLDVETQQLVFSTLMNLYTLLDMMIAS